jgi:hypothetical protein
MFSFSSLIQGIIGLIGGIAIIYYAFALNHRVFFLDFVERKYGGGSGTTAYRLIGLLVCIFSMFLMVGKINLAGNINGDTGAPTNKNNVPSKVQVAPSNSGGSLLGQ